MADKMFDVTLALARELNATKERKATGGSTTTVIDTVGRKEVDDYWNEGTVWITEDAGGEEAAPEDEFAIVSDFVQSTATITCDTLTAAVVSTDKYAISSAKYPLDMMIGSINKQLSGVYVPVWNSTAIDTAAAQTEYTMPTNLYRGDLLEVLVQTITSDANDNRWQKVNRWRVKESATGTADTLILPQLTPSRDIALVYKSRHPNVYDAADTINEIIDLRALVIHSAIDCMQYRMSEGDDNKYITGQTNLYLEMAEGMPIAKYPLKKAAAFNVISQPSRSEYTGEVGAVRLGG